MVWRYTYERDVRFKVGDEKLFHVLQLEVYASIEADLIYSENLAALPSQREEQQRATFRNVFISRQLSKAATTLESVITAGIILL
jgi:hypothetical protein